MIGGGDAMKKTSFVNLFIVMGLLVLCVMTLIAVYATAPASSVLLLEDGFDGLDASKWVHEVADCEEDAGHFHYVTADEENRLIADGVLHIYPNITSVHFRTKRETSKKCYSCSGSGNSTVDCVSSLISANLQTREAYNATRGRVEIRAKICCGGQIQFNIGITSNPNSSQPEDSFPESGNATAADGNTSRIRIFYESAFNKTILTSSIPDNDFHIYEIEWDEERISLEMDGKKLEEKSLEERKPETENISNGTVKLDSVPISKPFYLNVGVGFKDTEREPENADGHPNNKRSVDSSNESSPEGGGGNVLEVDYAQNQGMRPGLIRFCPAMV